MKVIAIVVAFCILVGPAHKIRAQSTNASTGFGLSDSTPVKLRLGRTLSSADAKTGETVDFEVLEEIKIGEVVVLARGATAIGTVTRAKPKGRMGKGGKLDIVLDSVRLVSGEKIALRASKDTKGGSHAGAMTGAIVATSIIFFPAAPLFLFIKGKDITIPKGTEITAYVNGDISLDPRQFSANNVAISAPGTETKPRQDPVSESVPVKAASIAGNDPKQVVAPDAAFTAAPPTGNDHKQPTGIASTTGISVKSTPDGADIEVDGKFVGSTPSSLQLSVGDHKITVKMSGFEVWERTITLSYGSSVVVNASLEKRATQAQRLVDEKTIPTTTTPDRVATRPSELNVTIPAPSSSQLPLIERPKSPPSANIPKTIPSDVPATKAERPAIVSTTDAAPIVPRPPEVKADMPRPSEVKAEVPRPAEVKTDLPRTDEVKTVATGPGEMRKTTLGIELVWIPPGEFVMGSTDGEKGEKPVRTVKVSEGFWMARHEVTQVQWFTEMGLNPSSFG